MSDINYSTQPRFKDTEVSQDIFTSIMTWVDRADKYYEAYKTDSRARDKWLRSFLPTEPNLMGIMNTVVDIDKNRGWRMMGGRNQVQRFTQILHNFQASPGLVGWRPGISMASKSYWGADMGSIVELGSEGKGGPLRALYTVDSARCKLTGDNKYPLQYFPIKGKMQKWSDEDYIRTVSMPSEDEAFNGLGFCAVSRSYELAKLMLAVYGHYSEQLGSKAPRGFFLLKGIGRQQFEEAMRARDANLETIGYEYYGALAVLASLNSDVDGKLIALSQLPAGFSLREWTDMLIYGYSMIWGFDPSEFWPVQFGAMGRGNETQIQHEKATAKGRLDFALSFQEQLQAVLPETINFVFEQRDDQGDLLHAQINQAWANVVKTLYEAGITGPEGSVILRPEARILLADYGIIPDDWTEVSDITTSDMNEDDPEDEADHEESPTVSVNEPATDNTPGAPETPKKTPDDNLNSEGKPKKVKIKYKEVEKRHIRDRLMNNSEIVSAAYKFPTEPIIQYSWPSNFEVTLWESGEDLLRKRVR